MTAARTAAFLLSVFALAVAGCGPAPAATPTATAAPTVALATVTSTPAPTATPTPAPTTSRAATPTIEPTAAAEELPEGWQRKTTDQLSIALPPEWRTLELGGEDAQTLFDELQKTNPDLAGVIGGPKALESAVLWTFGPLQIDFVDNMNIRRSPWGLAGRLYDLDDAVEVLLPQYEKMGMKVSSTDTGLRIFDLPTARVSYTMQVKGASGEPLEVRGRQYLLAAERDLWVISYSTTSEREETMAEVFERSVQSFRSK